VESPKTGRNPFAFITAIADEILRDYGISLTGGSLCNFNKRWNPQKLGETLLLLLLGRDFGPCKNNKILDLT
jgi:hypothetical protein